MKTKSTILLLIALVLSSCVREETKISKDIDGKWVVAEIKNAEGKTLELVDKERTIEIGKCVDGSWNCPGRVYGHSLDSNNQLVAFEHNIDSRVEIVGEDTSLLLDYYEAGFVEIFIIESIKKKELVLTNTLDYSLLTLKK